MDSKRIVLAFNGDLASCVAVKWLAETHAAEVVTLTVDVGQHDEKRTVARWRAARTGRMCLIGAKTLRARSSFPLPDYRGRARSASAGCDTWPIR